MEEKEKEAKKVACLVVLFLHRVGRMWGGVERQARRDPTPGYQDPHPHRTNGSCDAIWQQTLQLMV